MENRFQAIADQVSTVIMGKADQIGLALVCLFARGHLLIEDRPGIGKTTMAQGLTRCLGLSFRRIQFTNDLLPGDMLGVSVYEQESGAFVFHPGPIFTQVLLADEINRATPKTQSALLEAMEERQVTLDGTTRPLPTPFFVIATQNPIEQAGTFPLPDSQLDRFLMRVNLGYPDREAEYALFSKGDTKARIPGLSAVLSPEDILAIQEEVEAVTTSRALVDYVLDVVDFTRHSGRFHVGLSPRAGLGVLRAAQSNALIDGRTHVLPEDVQRVLPWVTSHRLQTARHMQPFTHDELMELFREVPLP